MKKRLNRNLTQINPRYAPFDAQTSAMMFPALMVSEREIASVAVEVVSQQREAAGSYALNRAHQLHGIGAFEAAKSWRRILAEIERL